MSVTIAIEPTVTPELQQFLDQGLTDHYLDYVQGEGFWRIAALARDPEDQIVGGVVGLVNWNWMYISTLWTAAYLRGQGVGTGLMQTIETEALQQGCTWMHLDTFTFQAPGFYESLGYQRFATLEDYPPGHERIFYKKPLISE